MRADGRHHELVHLLERGDLVVVGDGGGELGVDAEEVLPLKRGEGQRRGDEVGDRERDGLAPVVVRAEGEVEVDGGELELRKVPAKSGR